MKKLLTSLTLGASLLLGSTEVKAFPLSTDTVILTPKASVSCPAGKVCVYSLSGDGQLYVTDTSGIQIRTNTALRFNPKATAPGSASNGDVYFNTSTGKFQFYASGWGALPGSSGGLGFDSSSTPINYIIAGPASGSAGSLLARAMVTADLPVVDKTKGGTGQDNTSITVNKFFASPTGGTGAASFRVIDATDIPGVTLTNIYSGMFSAEAVALTINSTRYLGLPGTATDSATRISLGKVPSLPGKIRGLSCGVLTAPGTGDSVIVTVGTSTDEGATWVDSAETCTISNTATTCYDPSNIVSVAAGTRMSLKMVNSLTSSAVDLLCTWRLTQ